MQIPQRLRCRVGHIPRSISPECDIKHNLREERKGSSKCRPAYYTIYLDQLELSHVASHCKHLHHMASKRAKVIPRPWSSTRIHLTMTSLTLANIPLEPPRHICGNQVKFQRRAIWKEPQCNSTSFLSHTTNVAILQSCYTASFRLPHIFLAVICLT